VKWWASIAVLAVVIQGVLGGLRVTEHNALLGLFPRLPGSKFSRFDGNHPRWLLRHSGAVSEGRAPKPGSYVPLS